MGLATVDKSTILLPSLYPSGFPIGLHIMIPPHYLLYRHCYRYRALPSRELGAGLTGQGWGVCVLLPFSF